MPSIPRFGLFCDGTGNNMFNALRDARDDDEPTNVAKLYQLYKVIAGVTGKHYEIGVGTATGGNANYLAMGFALDFEKRLQSSLRALRQFARGFPPGSTLTVDVFGFSRGAALGRAFINEVQRLTKVQPEFWGGVPIRIGFVGLFDTVASIGLPGDDSHGRFNLDLDPQLIDYCYHLTARHEQRAYFPLHSILSAGGEEAPQNFREEELPGAHADIGGGYGPLAQVVHFPPFLVHWRNVRQKTRQIDAMVARYTAQFGTRLTPDMRIEVQEAECVETNPVAQERQSTMLASWTRHVENTLAHVALEKMHRLALEHRVPFEESLAALAAAQMAYEIPEALRALLQRLPRDADAEVELYREYIHHSHQFAGPAGAALNPNLPEKAPRQAAPNGRREIFYNDPQNAYSPADQWQLRPGFDQLDLPEEFLQERWERV